MELYLIGLKQVTTLREVCDLYKKYRMGSKDPELQKWYYRLKAKDDETISNLQNYISRKIYNR